jgi:hypothetical protein
MSVNVDAAEQPRALDVDAAARRLASEERGCSPANGRFVLQHIMPPARRRSVRCNVVSVVFPDRRSAGAEKKAVFSKPLAFQSQSAPVAHGWSCSWRCCPPSIQRLVPKPCVHAAYRADWLGGCALAAYRGGEVLSRRGEFGLPGSWWLGHTERLTRRCRRIALRAAAERQPRCADLLRQQLP